jgi:MFS family permease
VPTKRRINTLILFSGEFRTRTLTITLLWFLTMFVSIGVTTWLPSIFVNVLHIPVHRSLVYAAVTSCLMQAFVPLSGFLVDRFGRRAMGWGTMLLTSGPLLGLALYPPANELFLVVLVAISQLANLIGAFALWPYTAETYRTDVRALALGYASAVGRFSSVVTPIFVGFVLNEGGSIGIVFAGFGLCALGASLTWGLRTRETAGIKLEAV